MNIHRVHRSIWVPIAITIAIILVATLTGCALAPVTAENAHRASDKNLCYRTQDAAARTELARRGISLYQCQLMVAQRDQALWGAGSALMIQGLDTRSRSTVCVDHGVHTVCQ